MTSDNDDDDSNTTKYDPESLDCIKSALLSLCLIVQSQLNDSNDTNNSIQLLNKNSLRKLLKNFSHANQLNLLINTLDELNESGSSIEKFLKCLLTRTLVEFVEYDRAHANSLNTMSMDLDANDDENELKLKGKNNACFEFMLSLVNKLNLSRASPRLVEYLVDLLFETMIKQIDDFDKSSGALPNLLVEFHLCELVYKFECKYASVFDRCLSKILCGGGGDANSIALNQKQRNYFLTTISCKFSSFKCKSTFKYQQVVSKVSSAASSEASSDLNLVIALNPANEGRIFGHIFLSDPKNWKTRIIFDVFQAEIVDE